MELLISILALLGMGYAVFRGLKWMLAAGQTQARRDQPLSPADLKILEESAARLMADLNATTDECVARIERACAEARVLLESPEPTRTYAHPTQQASTSSPIAPADTFAGQPGMTTGELELIRSLRAIVSSN